MKKNFFILTAIVFASFGLFSCSSSDDNGGKEDPKELLDLPYSTLSVADQKKKLSSQGEATIAKLQDLPNEASVELIASFNEISEGLFYLLEETPVKSKAAESIIKLSKYYGEYAWDAKTEEWTKSDKEVTDKLIAIFPSSRKATSNDGKIEIKATASNVVIENNEIPSNVVADLYVSNSKKGAITLNTTGINESSFVETANLNVLLGSYNLTADVDKKDNKNSAKMNFTKGSDAIIKASADLEAKITAEILDREDLSSVKDANLVITIAEDLAIAGYVDGKSLLAEFDKIEKEEDIEKENYQWDGGKLAEYEQAMLDFAKRRITALNKYSNLALVSTSEEYKVAKVTFDLDIYEYESTGYFDKDGDGEIDYEEEMYKYTAYYTSEMYILNFDDKTKTEASVFFGEGFDKIAKMWNDFILKFN